MRRADRHPGRSCWVPGTGIVDLVGLTSSINDVRARPGQPLDQARRLPGECRDAVANLRIPEGSAGDRITSPAPVRWSAPCAADQIEVVPATWRWIGTSEIVTQRRRPPITEADIGDLHARTEDAQPVCIAAPP